MTSVLLILLTNGKPRPKILLFLKFREIVCCLQSMVEQDNKRFTRNPSSCRPSSVSNGLFRRGKYIHLSCFHSKYQPSKDLMELFNSIDMDSDGALCLSEVITFLKSITDDLSIDNIEKIFNSLDKSGDRSVDFDEFKV